MRRTLGFVLFASFAGTIVGCFTKGNQPAGPVSAGKAGSQTGDGDKEHTLEYWGKVREVLQLKTNSQDMHQVASLVQRQSDTVRRLSTDFVDYDLKVAALAVAQYQEKLLKAAEDAGYNPAALRSDPELKKTYTNACGQIAGAISRLKSLQPTLSTRYGVTFPPIDEGKE